MSDQFATWRRAVAGEQVLLHDGEPNAGFYRVRRNGSQASAVAYWRDTKSNILRCHVNGVDVAENVAFEQWPYAAREPVTHEVYKARIDTGKWPDMDDAAFATLPSSREVIGNNQPPDEMALLKEQIESASAGIKAYEKITSDEMQAKAQSLRARLLELGGDADKKRDKEKRPHLEAGRIIDKKWKPLVEMAEGAANMIRAAMRGWENEKDRRAREAAAKAEANNVAREAAGLAPTPVPTPDAAPAPIVKGAYGRAASVRIVKVAVIVDQLAVYKAFADRQDVKDLLQKLAQKAIDAGFDVPGVQVKTERDVR